MVRDTMWNVKVRDKFFGDDQDTAARKALEKLLKQSDTMFTAKQGYRRQETDTDPTLIHLTALQGLPGCLAWLLSMPKAQQPFDATTTSSIGLSPVHSAARGAHSVAAAKVLLDNGGSIWAPDSKGCCPMAMAYEYNTRVPTRIELIRLFWSHARGRDLPEASVLETVFKNAHKDMLPAVKVLSLPTTVEEANSYLASSGGKTGESGASPAKSSPALRPGSSPARKPSTTRRGSSPSKTRRSSGGGGSRRASRNSRGSKNRRGSTNNRRGSKSGKKGGRPSRSPVRAEW